MKKIQSQRTRKNIIHIILFYTTTCFLLFSCCNCSFQADPKSGMGGFEGRKTGNALKIINWNLQTFFDAQTCGKEYASFRGSKTSWNEEQYKKRLKKLCLFIVEHDADVYVFEEIENADVLQDISNHLPAINRGKNPWQYACFGNDLNSALGVAVLSRYALSDIQLHQIDYRVAYRLFAPGADSLYDGTTLSPPSMRPLLEVTICSEKELKLFVCHWKSKAGDKDGETALWRRLQERLLADRILSIEDTTIPYLVSGDFNQTLFEFDEQGSVWQTTQKCDTSVYLHGTDDTVLVYSPWNRSTAGGSYMFEGRWERIDHFFSSPALQLDEFDVITKGEHTENGIPIRYDVWANKGWSDHAPILCWVSFK